MGTLEYSLPQKHKLHRHGTASSAAIIWNVAKGREIEFGSNTFAAKFRFLVDRKICNRINKVLRNFLGDSPLEKW